MASVPESSGCETRRRDVAMFKWSRASLGSATKMNQKSSENGFLRPTRIPYKVLYALLFTLIVVIIVLLCPSGFFSPASPVLLEDGMILIKEDYSQFGYNTTYPLTTPSSELYKKGRRLRFLL
jgi:hypothetical protein